MKLIALIMGLMIAVLSLITTITPGSKSYNKPNPVAEIGKEFAKPLAHVDVEISNALERNGMKLPSLTGAKPAKDKTGHMLQDYTGAAFANMDLPRSNFAGSFVSNAQFNETLLDGASLEGATGEKVNFKGARMAKTILNASMLPGSDFSGAELREAQARAGDFSNALFVGSDLSFSTFAGAQLGAADFRAAYGAGASFVGADANLANFDGANLTGVRFKNAILDGASFAGADMNAADLTGARLYGTDLSGAVNLSTDQLAMACVNGDTKLPGGVSAPRC